MHWERPGFKGVLIQGPALPALSLEDGGEEGGILLDGSELVLELTDRHLHLGNEPAPRGGRRTPPAFGN